MDSNELEKANMDCFDEWEKTHLERVRASKKPSKKQLACQHETVQVEAKVGRVTKDDNPEELITWMADIRLVCQSCGMPFHFKGIGAGISYDSPRVDPHGIELRVPVSPGLGGILTNLTDEDRRYGFEVTIQNRGEQKKTAKH
jgi:hypothetical protein